MTNETQMETFGEEKLYDFVRVGSFGRFKTGESFPIDFVMTTFTATELYQKLNFARDIETSFLDFELLMQRDIDEDRVRREVEPYLNRGNRPAPERRGIVFFPPLLAAIVPVEHERMLEHYSREDVFQTDTKPPLIVREWKPFFQIRYFPSLTPDATVVGSGEKTFRVKNEAEVCIRIAEGDGKGAKLIVIDGQHRLMALRRVYEDAKAQLKELLVPVCIVFPPCCTDEVAERSKPVLIPNVPQVFRSLFVDVNEKMERVGGHFTILLSDDTIPSLAVRRFCDLTLKSDGSDGLAKIEWNIRTRKNSEELNRPYSLTSIGLLSKALTTLFRRQPERLFYVLNLAEVESELHPEGQQEEEYPKNIRWDSFSISQKPVIESQIDKYVVPALRRILFDVVEHREKGRVFDEQLVALRAVVSDPTPGVDETRIAKKVLRNVIDYKPIAESDDEGIRGRTEFFRRILTKKQARCAAIVDYALFQRAIIDVWGAVIDEARVFEVELRNVVDVVVYLLDTALSQKGRTFDFKEPYMQHSVFVGSRIKPKEDTRRALGHLVEAHLGSPGTAAEAAKRFCRGSGASVTDVTDRLRERGIDAANAFGRYFARESERTFERTYMVNLAIDIDRRRELEVAAQQYEKEYAEYKAGQRQKEDITQQFRQMVELEVAKDVELAMQALKARLGLDVDVLLSEEEPEDEDQE